MTRLLIQQASWCCRPEPGRLGSPRRGSECPVIDQFSLSVHTGPGQRSGGNSPGGHSHCAMDSHLVQSPQEQASVGPGWPRVLASAFPPLTPLCVPAGLARKPRLPGSWPAFASRSRRAAVCTWWAVQRGGRGPGLGAGPLGSGSAVRSGGPCIACSAVSSWDSRATHGDREDEPTQEAWRAQGRPRRAGAGPAAHLSCSSGGFRRAWCVQPPARRLGRRLLD